MSGLSSKGYLHNIPITCCYSSDGFRFLCVQFEKQNRSTLASTPGFSAQAAQAAGYHTRRAIHTTHDRIEAVKLNQTMLYMCAE